MDLACAELFSARTGKPSKYYLDKWDRRDWWLTAKDALEEGLVDEITPSPVYKKLRKKPAA
jgi:ATP-dependent protease ClpP protease subunit